MPTPLYDFTALPPRRITVDLVGSSIEGGRALSGATQAISFSGGGFWRVDYPQLVVRKPWQHRYWKWLRNYLAGGVNPIIVPIWTDYVAPFGSGHAQHGIPHSDDSFFSDDAGYESGGIEANLTGTAPLHATSIALHMTTGRRLEAGDSFSIEHPTMGWRYYSIVSVDTPIPTDPAGDDTDYTLTIVPPLREATTSGTVVEFYRPKCTMRLMPGTSLAWDTSTTPWLSEPDISFCESFGNG